MGGQDDYFEKQRSIRGWDQAVLERTHVLIVGVGGIGSVAALACARLGIGKLTLVDVDHIEASNLNRQLLYAKGDIGKQKVECAKDQLSAVHTLTSKIEGQDFNIFQDWQRFKALVQEVDFVYNGLDLPEVKKLAVANLCLTFRKPMIFSGTDPVSGNAGMILFQHPAGKPCYNCLTAAIHTVPEAFWGQLSPDQIADYSSLPIEEMSGGAVEELPSATNVYTAATVTMLGIDVMVHWLFQWQPFPNRIILDLYNFTLETWTEKTFCDFCKNLKVD